MHNPTNKILYSLSNSYSEGLHEESSWRKLFSTLDLIKIFCREVKSTMEIKDASTGKSTVGPDPARQNSSNQKTSSDNCRIEASNACKEAVERVETKVKQYVCVLFV